MPVFVPLDANVANKVNELRDEWREALRNVAPVHAAAPILPAPAAAVVLPVPADAAHPVGFMDLDEVVAEHKEDKKDDRPDGIAWELDHWFCADAPALPWNNADSQPAVQWKQDQVIFPRLAFLARRFLSILPTSAASERVWYGFGHVITDHSASIDSTRAAQTMYLRYNRDLVAKIPPVNTVPE